MQRSTKKIKPEVDYRQFRFKKMNTPEFSHVKLLLFWPFFGLMFMFLERFQPERHYYVVHCALDDLIPFWEWALIPYLLWFVFLIGALMTNFWGLSVQDEKEIVLILTESANKVALMKCIGESCGMHSEAQGIVMSMPIDSVAGI